MSNVEESLETQARIGALRCEGGPHSPTGHLLRQLADEIERLRAEVAALQDQRREMHADTVDLAMLVRRLALALRKAQPEHSTVSDAAMEFLRKRGLDGEVLR